MPTSSWRLSVLGHSKPESSAYGLRMVFHALIASYDPLNSLKVTTGGRSCGWEARDFQRICRVASCQTWRFLPQAIGRGLEPEGLA